MEQKNDEGRRAVGGGCRLGNRIAIKGVLLGGLALGMLIPLAMVSGVMAERRQRSHQVTNELSETWGAMQEIIGPVWVVPYRRLQAIRREVARPGEAAAVEKVQTIVERAYFLPAELQVSADLDPQILARGIYEAVVYRGAVRVKGVFLPPSFADWDVAPEDILWDESYLAVGVSDLRGAPDTLSLAWGDHALAMMPVSGSHDWPAGARAVLKDQARITEPVAFALELTLNGSYGFRVAPIGDRNQIQINSAWPDPSFQGAMLPVDRAVSGRGFSASWKSSLYGRGLPSRWVSTGSFSVTLKDLQKSLVGVDLLKPVDHYRLSERAVKYGFFIVFLVFTVFYLFEIGASLRIHPFQYALVGAAVCLFYLALLSLSEVISFARAYAAGAAACTALISVYGHTALRSRWRAATMAAALLSVYGVLYVILRLQDYALLVGTAGLFAALAIVMFVTRKVDWYARDEVA